MQLQVAVLAGLGWQRSKLLSAAYHSLCSTCQCRPRPEGLLCPSALDFQLNAPQCIPWHSPPTRLSCSPPGSFTRITGAQTCDQCPAGEFSNVSAATGCTPCGPGQVSGGPTSAQCCWEARELQNILHWAGVRNNGIHCWTGRRKCPLANQHGCNRPPTWCHPSAPSQLPAT